jgi:hypothetical protein
MRRYDTMRGKNVEDRRKEDKLTAPITLPPLDEQTLIDLRCCYEEPPDAETRTRYQMLLLSAKGQTSTQIAQLVLRSQDTVVRVLKRFLTGGLEAVPRRSAPGRERRITQAWESERLASDRAGSTRGGSRQRQLDHREARRVLRHANGYSSD